ncbi:putative membrane protein [Teratosphaeria destructans]|uniref:Efficient mitochondria targeting-associated protein 19 n=1 Tax=Teratosphaeria destructans TaxID=418781 RepID=A0A9W7SMB5_9PEZI|nr:putative membrane protein [Teratosphaeria destructans]
MPRSTFSRKRDLTYLTFFLIHIPIVFFVDSAPLWPEALKPTFMTTLRTFYIETYHDQFFTSPPAWFTMYMWMDVLYHVPLSIWAVGALLRDDPRLPIHLLVYAVQTAITTSTCISDYLGWDDFSNAEKIELGKLYVPYLAVSVFMGVDMYARLTSRLGGGSMSSQKKVM